MIQHQVLEDKAALLFLRKARRRAKPLFIKATLSFSQSHPYAHKRS